MKKKILFIYGTRHGTIYNITANHLPQIEAIQLSVGDFHDHRHTIKSLPNNISFRKYLGFPEEITTYLSSYDLHKKQCILSGDNSQITKIRCSNGFTPFSASDYDEMAELIKPNYLVTLTEYPQLTANKQQNYKAIIRAINKTKSYLQKSHFGKSTHQGTKIMASVHGGSNMNLLQRSLQEIMKHQCEGLTICGINKQQTIENKENIYNKIVSRIAESKRMYELCLAGMGQISDIKLAIKFGFTIFQINYPFFLAQNHLVLIKLEDGTYKQRRPELSTILKPLDANCTCYTCKKHNQSYIAHLISCNQLNAKILLSIHNLQVYIDLHSSLS